MEKEHYQQTIKQCSANRRWQVKKQRLVLRQAGRKCFLFESVLYPLVTKKRDQKERGRVVEKHEKKFTQPQVQGVPC